MHTCNSSERFMANQVMIPDLAWSGHLMQCRKS